MLKISNQENNLSIFSFPFNTKIQLLVSDLCFFQASQSNMKLSDSLHQTETLWFLVRFFWLCFLEWGVVVCLGFFNYQQHSRVYLDLYKKLVCYRLAVYRARQWFITAWRVMRIFQSTELRGLSKEPCSSCSQ